MAPTEADILAARWWSTVRRKSGEEKLLVAILENAMQAIAGDNHEEADEAMSWVLDNREYPSGWSFPAVCDILGVDIGWLRGVLKKQADMRDVKNEKRKMLQRTAVRELSRE